MVKLITSGKITLLLIAVVSGMYLFATFGNDNALTTVLVLLKENTVVRVLFAFLYIQFFLKGMYRLYEGRTRYAISALFFISLSLVTAGIAFSVVFRSTEKLRMNVSDKKELLKVIDIQMNLPENFLIVGDRSEFKIKDVEVLIEDNGERKALRPFPFTETLSGYAYINDAGISPDLDIDINGLVTPVSKVQLFPPNRKQIIDLQNGFHAEISLSPEREFKKGRLNAREYNLHTPRYELLIKRDKAPFFDEILQDGERREQDGIRVVCGKTEKWVEIAFVKDSTVSLLYAGFIGVVLGIILYPIEFYRNIFL